MRNPVFKNVLRAKLSFIDSAINVFPPKLKEQAVVFQKGILEAVQEVTEEFLADQPDNKKKKEEGITSVQID